MTIVIFPVLIYFQSALMILISEYQSELTRITATRKQRFINEYQLSDYDAEQLAGNTDSALFFESCIKVCQDAKLSANWIMGELASQQRTETTIAASQYTEQLGGLIVRIKDGTVSSKTAKTVFNHLWQQQAPVLMTSLPKRHKSLIAQP